MRRTILGLSFGFHDAGVAVVDYDTGEILFASQSERYSRIKNDPWLNDAIMEDALSYGNPKVIAINENPWKKKLRHLRAFDFQEALFGFMPKRFLKFYPELNGVPVKYFDHHLSHFATGLLTGKKTDNYKNPMTRPREPKLRSFGSLHQSDYVGMVVDAIGEMDTASIWTFRYFTPNKGFTQEHAIKYPSSIGLFYSALTHYVGLKPNEDEYILMGMAAYGDPEKADYIARHLARTYFIDDDKNPFKAKVNLHKGIANDPILAESNEFDIARAAQIEFQDRVYRYAAQAKKHGDHLIYGGGCALNCTANTQIFDMFDTVRISTAPGDSGSALGAAGLVYYNKAGEFLNGWTPYLGYNIEGAYPINDGIRALREGKIFGIANGRAEFGPRALGNRSLFADPRDPTIKDKVNEIKQRQDFRPFAPIVLREEVDTYFEVPIGTTISPYMQTAIKCRYPEEFPGIVHADGSSRIQIVDRHNHPSLHMMISEWNTLNSGRCPMLLNTSLNIKGQPIVNDEKDAKEFAKTYGVDVFTSAA